MRTCAQCGRLFPEVGGAASQVCPHCGHEQADARSPLPAASARASPADAVGALSAGARLFARRWGHLLLAWSPALVVDILVVATIGVAVRAMGIDLSSNLTAGQAMQALGVALPPLLLSVAAKLFCWSLVARLTLDELAPGRRPAFRARAGGAFGLALLLTVVFAGGLLLLLVPFLFVFHWFLFAPAAYADGRSAGESMSASRVFAARHRTMGFSVVVLVLAVTISLGKDFLGGRAGAALGGEIGAFVAAYLPAVLSWLVSPLLAVLPAAFYALASEAEPVMASEAPRVERVKLSKCPRCAALVPVPEDDALVECAVCGHKGRVL